MSYKPLSRARYIKGSPKRLTPLLRDKLVPFFFTAFFGAWLGGLSWESSRPLEKRFIDALSSNSLLGYFSLGFLVFWGLNFWLARQFQNGVGTLYVISALRCGAPPKDLASGAIGRAFHRVRRIPHLELDFEGTLHNGVCRFGRLVRQSVFDFYYALGDDSRDSADNILINSDWWFGWGFGAFMAQDPKKFAFTNKLFQWYVPASNKAEIKVVKSNSIGGEGVKAVDILELKSFVLKLQNIGKPLTLKDYYLTYSPRKAFDNLCDESIVSKGRLAYFSLQLSEMSGDGPSAIVLELGPQNLSDVQDGRQLFLNKLKGESNYSLLESGAFGQLFNVMRPREIHWITWRFGLSGDTSPQETTEDFSAGYSQASDGGDGEKFTPISPRDFENVVYTVLPILEGIMKLSGSRKIVMFASIPEALQIPFGFGLETISKGSLQRLLFAAYDQSSGNYRIVDLSDGNRDSKSPDQLESVQVVNLTPHPVVLVNELGLEIRRWESKGRAFLKEELVDISRLRISDGNSVEVSHIRHGDTEGLPNPSQGIVFLVSRVTAMANPNRSDLYFPSDEVRNADGRISGCLRLGRILSPWQNG